jgi:ABC-type phosphate/phosphonate transport system ATPase subunit
VGLRGGAVVFDGPPSSLTEAAVAELYGAQAH